MALKTGTLDINGLLAVENLSVVEYGLDAVNDALVADRAVHNMIVNDDLIGDLCERTTKRGFVYGASSGGEMVDLDQYGRAPTQTAEPGAPLDIPMLRKGTAIGWTYDWFLTKTPADAARAQIAAEIADLRAVTAELQRAIFGSANYTIRDRLVDNYPLNVKRFVNADSAAIPNGPNAEVFNPATHTHYDASATLTAAALLSLIGDVVEHNHGAGVRLYISSANEAAVTALTGFYAYQDPRIVPALTAARANGTIDITRTNNRAIGIFGSAEVWVKSWMPTNYYFAFSAADPRKPLAFREPENAALRGFRTVAQNGAFPMYAEYMERRFGVGVRTRTNGAVLFVDAGGVYVTPTF